MVKLVTQFDNADSKPSLATPTCAGCCCCCCCCVVSAISVAAISGRNFANPLRKGKEEEFEKTADTKIELKKNKADIVLFMLMLLAGIVALNGLFALSLFDSIFNSAASDIILVPYVTIIFAYFTLFIALVVIGYPPKYLLTRTLLAALIMVPSMAGELLLLLIIIQVVQSFDVLATLYLAMCAAAIALAVYQVVKKESKKEIKKLNVNEENE